MKNAGTGQSRKNAPRGRISGGVDLRGLAVIVAATVLLVLWCGWCLRCSLGGLPSSSSASEIPYAGAIGSAGYTFFETVLSSFF
ncbi:MAG TPA: hypothetical protein PKI32_07165 [Opitutales bacterium]|nr:hypothetical protein [Opitutales bacterium]